MKYLLSSILFCSLPVFATPHKTLDLKNSTDGDGGEREISFCARPSPDTIKNIPGHMFVAFSLVPKSGNRSYTALGHTTKEPLANVLITYLGFTDPVSGFLDEERYTSTLEQCLVLKVNKADYDTAFAIAKPNLDKYLPGLNAPLLRSYSLGDKDCMEFTISIANLFKSKGLNVPVRKATELPLTYVRRLIDSN